ncbi:SanA/YdcF family protein [Flectobacillus major]|jgi:SanA protein|uniref:SanA/YdcF family protein n=1 Tax=Flectobacillus major TaxID=103 RepID=UPI00042957A9|nr:ElyC/SanA/YdcF family protein [Flectobacillus major]
MKNTLEISIQEPINITRFVKRVIKGLIAIIFLAIVGILLCNIWIVLTTANRNYYDINSLPPNDFALVLGTSKSVHRGKENLFFKYRMEAAARLFKEGKVKFLILSGNHDSVFYNEPADMRNALLQLGVPANVMILDFAGFRTYDSIFRCKNVFSQHRFTIVSQPTHNARALFLAEQLGVDAVAFAAQDVPSGYKTYIREYLACPKAILDVYFLETSKYSKDN